MGVRAGTSSIVARDKESGELGVAVQSHWFSVGSIVALATSPSISVSNSFSESASAPGFCAAMQPSRAPYELRT